MQHSEREYEEMRQELLSSKRKYESYSKELACKLLQEDGFVEVIKNRAIFRQVKYMDQSLELKGRVEKAFCFWDFIPVRIVLRRKPKDVSYKKFVFVYFMHVEKNDIKSDQRDAYTLRIVTAWNGTLLQKSFFKGEFPKDFPCKFAYPKRIVAKINQYLMNNFFLDLWEGPRYAAWYHTEAGLATFMGTLELEATSSIGALQSLLESSISEAAGVLLAFMCFSMMKPFFPTFHRLDKNSSYLKARKYISHQIALNIRSNCSEFSERLAMCCCGFFQSEDFSDFPIIDGISIQKSSRKSVKLGIDEFEAKILQPASVLWINRIPSEELIANGKIFDIYVSPQAILPNGFSKTVAISIAEGIHTFTEIGVCNSLKRTDENRLIIKKFLCDLKEIVSKYSSYPFAMELEEELQEMQENINNRSFLADKDTIEYISFVGTIFKAVIAKYRLEFEEQFSRTRKGLTAITLESFERETNSNISVFLRNLRQSQKKAKEEEFTLYSYFERAWKTFEKIDTVHNLKKCNIEKIAYLSASFRVFAFECLPPKINISIRKKMCERVDLALINMTMRQIKGSNAKTILEQHILQLIKHNRIARIRGKQSAEGNIAIWFDSQSDTFLLPMDTYFEELRETANLEISQRQFENMLEKRRCNLYSPE